MKPVACGIVDEKFLINLLTLQTGAALTVIGTTELRKAEADLDIYKEAEEFLRYLFSLRTEPNKEGK